MARYDNAPDDDRSYIRTCPAGHRWHASEGGCGKCDEARERAAMEPCTCGYEFGENYFDLVDGGSWHATCPVCEREVWR